MKSEPAFYHFINSLLSVPALNNDSVHGAHQTRSVGSVFAMHKKGTVFFHGNNFQKFYYILCFRIPCTGLYMLWL